MLTAFRLQNLRLEQLPIAEPDALAEAAVCIYIVEPTAQERAGITRAYDVRLPDAEDMQEIEATARFYKDEDGLHIHSFFLDDFAETPTNITEHKAASEQVLRRGGGGGRGRRAGGAGGGGGGGGARRGRRGARRART